jgi:phospholipid/cholesterol/gamma-HCH transport system permease protein
MNFRLEHSTEAVVLHLEGDLLRSTAKQLSDQVRRLLAAPGRALVLDFAGVEHADSSGAAALLEGLRAAHRAGVRVQIENVRGQVRQLLEIEDLGRLAGEADPPLPARVGLVEQVGGLAIEGWTRFLELAYLNAQSLYWTFVAPLRGRRLRRGEVSRQIVAMGVKALPIVGMIMFLMGLILALRAAHQLRRVGAMIYIADMVAVSLTREIGPLLTAILLAGRTGSSITAEIGTMVVTEEVDALKAIGMHPVRFLVAPKLLGLVVSLPCLVVLADLVGITGGTAFAVLGLGLGLETYTNRTIQAVHLSDLMTGLVKSVVFAIIIVQVGAYQGFKIRGGAEGVGAATTLSVVVSLFFIVLTDVVFTWLFYVAE